MRRERVECDRCGFFWDKAAQDENFAWIAINQNGVQKDLCPDCSNAFKAFMAKRGTDAHEAGHKVEGKTKP